MILGARMLRFAVRVVAFAVLLCPMAHAVGQTGKVGIFDLDAIHAVPLKPEVVARSIQDGIVTEAVRITSVPGVRPLVVLTYSVTAKGRPGLFIARQFGAEARVEDAKTGFVAVSVAPPAGNDDPMRLDAVGGPKFDQQAGPRQYFTTDPNQSLLYHQVVALTRTIDYLATRPEIDLKQTAVLGAEWPGVAVALLHAIDDRPAAYFVWHGMGFYTDREGKSGDMAARFNRQAYEMYAPAAYAANGTRPIYFAGGLNGEMCPLEAFAELAKNLKSPKVFAMAPNREILPTAANEYSGSSAWQRLFTRPGGVAPSIAFGSVTVESGHLRYAVSASGVTQVTALVSYGEPGNWFGRNWHRIPLKLAGNEWVGEIPVYVPGMPLYVYAQGDTKQFGPIANAPELIEPEAKGIKEASATYPNSLLKFVPSDELYVATGRPTFGVAGPEPGMPAARILPRWDGMVRLRNIQPSLWKDAKELSFWVRGDETVGPLNAYFGVESRDLLDSDLQNYTMIPLVAANAALGTSWRKITIPLDQIADLARVDSLFLETKGKPLTIAGLTWH